MKKGNKQLVVILAGSAVLYYGVPFIFKLLPNESGMMMGIFLLLILNTLYCFVSSLFYTKKNSYNWSLSIFLGGLFVPSTLIFYNDSAMFYAFLYILASILGSLTGLFFLKRKRERQNNIEPKG